jgi:hypothetical protein
MQYKEKIEKKIIEILYKDGGELTFGKLEDRLKPHLDNNKFSYKTYSNRLKQLSKLPEEENNNDDQSSRYAIQPVLNRRDEKGRGGKVYYSLTKTARIRCDLDLPILNSETMIEKAYRILTRLLAFENSPYRKLKNVNEYNTFLQKLGINEIELQLVGKPGYNNKDFYQVSKWIHLDSGIKISSIEYLEGSDNYGKDEYSYQLPGISIKEFITNNESEKSKGLAYGHLDFKEDDEVNKYFKLLEDRRLIEKVIRSRYLITLNEDDRYIFVDNNNKKDSDKLREFFRKCWLLHGSVTVYLYQKWKSIQPPTDEERVWYEHLWGKDRSDQIINSCYQIRIKFNKSKNVKLEKEDIQKLLKSQLIGLQREFKSIKKAYSDIIEDYSYLANPLLNQVYPQFFRN